MDLLKNDVLKTVLWWPPPFLRGRVLTQMLLAFIAGLLLVAGSGLSSVFSLALAALSALGAALCFKHYKKAALALLLCGMAFLGCFLFARAEAQSGSFPMPAGDEAQVFGRVKTESVLRDENRYRLLCEVSEVNGLPWQGSIYIYYEGGPLLPGARVMARGKVMGFTPYGNPGAFDYGAYMRRQGIATSLSCYYNGEIYSSSGFAAAHGSVRGRLLAAFDKAAGENAALLKGIFLGDKSDLSFAQKSALSFSGVLHAFAVSGLHVGYLVGMVLLLVGAGRKKRWPRLLATIAMMLFYLRLTGTPASVLRACIMTLCLLTASALDEKSDRYTALSLAALLCLFYKPLWIMDAGFQLSFAAAFGIMYLFPYMRLLAGSRQAIMPAAGPRPFGERVKHFLSDTLAITMAASFATMPLVGYYFYHISVVGWLVSPLFVLGAGFTVICCFISALLAIFSAAWAALPLYLMDMLMRAMYGISAWSSTLPWAYIASGQSPLVAVLLFYAMLLALPAMLKKRRRPRLSLFSVLVLLVLLLTFSPALNNTGQGQLEVVFIDVGQGDAALLITPGGRSILVDGGGNRMSSGSVGENALMPYLRYRGLRRIDLLVSSHPDADHIDGLFTVLENMPVGQLLYAECFAENDLQQHMLYLAQQNGAIAMPAHTGMRFALEPGLTLEVCHPAAASYYSERDNNQGCLTVLITYDKIKFLLTGDVHLGDLQQIPAANIVKLPHHGSKSNYDEDAYAKLYAEAVVISVGRDNSYGHPGQNVIEYWQEKAIIYRTDRHGAVSIFSDGLSWRAGTYWNN